MTDVKHKEQTGITMSEEEAPKELTLADGTPKKKRGRPRKSEIAANKKGGRGVRGRPPGDAAKMNELKARMLASPKSESVLRAVLDTASDPEHPNFTACAKMVLDRILPSGMFEKDVLASKGASGITINIGGLGATVEGPKDITPEGEIIDG